MERTFRTKRMSAGLLALAVGFLGLVATADRRPAEAAPSGPAKCRGGIAANYPCKKIDLKGFISSAAMTGGTPSDVWGWRDPKTKKEYALVGTSRGTAFVDVSSPAKPKFLGNLPKPDRSFVWQDVEVYKNHAFVVCDLSPCGMQIFDLTRLRGVKAPQTWVPDVVYPVTATNHTIDINPDTGFAYLNGYYLSGGAHILDVSEPKRPVPVGFNLDDGYTHDSLCRIYKGPDKKFRKKEICFNFNEDSITLHDMTNKMSPTRISKVTYKGVAYTHYGALTKDHKYLVSNDELDEQNNGTNGTLFIWDVRKLSKPKLIGTFKADTKAIDHNVYTKGRYIYHATYTEGVRILDTKRIARGKLREVAYFDVMPLSNSATFDGTWAAYPFLPSGNVLVGDMSSGLFIVRPRL